MSLPKAVEQLCGLNCTASPEMIETVLDSRPAWIATIDRIDLRKQEWYFVDNGSKLIFFSVRDPATMETAHFISK